LKILEAWVSTPLAGALGWTLLHSLWEGAVIAAVLAATLAALRSARARYAAACVALLVMIGGMAVTLASVVPEHWHGLRTQEPPHLPLWNVETGADSAGPANAGLAALVPWLAPFWLAGVWIFAFGQAAGWIAVRRLRQRGVCCAPERWQQEIVCLCARLRLSRPVALLESCLAEVPMVMGHIRPVILMPIGVLAGLPVTQVEAILLHELAHILRHDYLVNVLQRWVECLLFYHPAVWWISGVIRSERENCCDDVVVAISGNAKEYALALTTLEEHRWSDREPALAASGGNLMKRIRRLLGPQRVNTSWTPLIAAAVLITTAVAAYAAWPSKPLTQSSAAPQRQAERTEISPYQRWLTEEIPYIIEPKEREAFLKLTTDEEREAFIKAFWERRNPHPGSPANEFKIEYYRRLAYANRHFASASKAGWKTDRGHMYILYGPPDEVEAHPSGKPYRFEQWMYKSMQGVVYTFIDRTGTGDYSLAAPPWKLPEKKDASTS
jgi:GWxTD domain-containing protein